ncbi:hypothetical protein L873DRAFT_897012 [Choiromyces venosus 120613-1]|uniref:Uncharacterized protein n=1 Tax=Choiromyces venosus 120613-1 TaxID=1336337 RepID=A0A3N4JRZ8_9PEZI|nr:hypothetical protein L873DRAFT_897012 [Choiromyces venosus 120613-1]
MDQIKQTLDQPKTIKAIIPVESGMNGPAIMPLPQMSKFDVTKISSYITRVFHQLDTQDTCSIFTSIYQCEGPVVPTFIFRLP